MVRPNPPARPRRRPPGCLATGSPIWRPRGAGRAKKAAPKIRARVWRARVAKRCLPAPRRAGPTRQKLPRLTLTPARARTRLCSIARPRAGSNRARGFLAPLFWRVPRRAGAKLGCPLRGSMPGVGAGGQDGLGRTIFVVSSCWAVKLYGQHAAAFRRAFHRCCRGRRWPGVPLELRRTCQRTSGRFLVPVE